MGTASAWRSSIRKRVHRTDSAFAKIRRRRFSGCGDEDPRIAGDDLGAEQSLRLSGAGDEGRRDEQRPRGILDVVHVRRALKFVRSRRTDDQRRTEDVDRSAEAVARLRFILDEHGRLVPVRRRRSLEEPDGASVRARWLAARVPGDPDGDAAIVQTRIHEREVGSHRNRVHRKGLAGNDPHDLIGSGISSCPSRQASPSREKG